MAGISRQSYYDWMELHDGFSDKIKVAQEYPDYVAKSLVVSAMKKGDVETGKWWLERRLRNEFATKKETDLTGDLTLKGLVAVETTDEDKTISLAE